MGVKFLGKIIKSRVKSITMRTVLIIPVYIIKLRYIITMINLNVIYPSLKLPPAYSK